MKIAQFTNLSPGRKTNFSFQRELWEHIWSKSSFENLVGQLQVNPIYWRLKKLISKKDKIIEAGCGFGQWVWQLSSEGYKVTGVDIAKKTINRLKKKHPKLDITVADVRNLPFRDETFSVYLSFGVIEHFVEGPDRVLKEAHRTLKKNGLLFLTVPYLNFFRFLRFAVFCEKQHGSFYQYLYTPGEVKSKIEKAGFKISRIDYYDFINAINKDFPFLKFLSKKIPLQLKINLGRKNKTTKRKIPTNVTRPKFLIQKILYKLDSYILLIEAYKK